MTTDGQFVRKLKAGDPQAYEALVDRFEAPLYRYFLASHGDEQLATEQSADCFGDLVESLPKITGGSEKLRAFVFAVARNVLRRRWRSQKRAHAPLGVSDEPADDWPSPDAAAEQMEESRRLIEAIRSLDEPTRDVFLLRFVELMPVAEIAATVGEPVGTIKSRLSRGASGSLKYCIPRANAMNDPHENLPDELLEDLLQQLRSVVPPIETQSANREAVREALAMRIRPVWWRQTIAVPVPLAIAASIALLLAATTFVRPSAFRNNGEQPSPLTAAEQANPTTQETNLAPNEAITPAWTIQRSFIRTLTSSTASEFVAPSPRENRDDS